MVTVTRKSKAQLKNTPTHQIKSGMKVLVPCDVEAWN